MTRALGCLAIFLLACTFTTSVRVPMSQPGAVACVKSCPRGEGRYECMRGCPGAGEVQMRCEPRNARNCAERTKTDVAGGVVVAVLLVPIVALLGLALLVESIDP